VLVKAASRVNGDLAIAPTLLTINKDQHKLIPSETAVAFSASPSWTRLTRTLTVTDNFNNFTGMSASSSATWLVAGVSGNQLVLTADPTPFGPDTLNIATVTLTPNDADAKAPEPIRVALWKGTLTPDRQRHPAAALHHRDRRSDPAVCLCPQRRRLHRRL
jgi:hypothetical protein